MKSVRGEYYLNGHWTIGGAWALPVASTVLHYERGAEGDLAPERLLARGPTSEPLVIEVRGAQSPGGRGGGSRGGAGLSEDPPAQLLSQEPNPGVRYEYHLPLGSPRPGFRWSHGSWSDCSAECGGGEPSACCGGTWGKPRAGGLHVPPPAPAPTPKLREPAVAFPRCWYLRGDLILCAAEARPGADDQLSERGPNTPDNTPQASVSSSVNWGMMMALILASHLRLNQDDAWDVCRIVPSPRMHRVTAD